MQYAYFSSLDHENFVARELENIQMSMAGS